MFGTVREAQRLTRTFAVLAAISLGVVGGLVTEAASKPVAAQASSVGGNISAQEVLSRAQWWINTYGVIYSQNQSDAKSDGDGHTYRPDCSGYVSMAWHLPKKTNGWDRYTGDLANFGDTTYRASLNDLQPADAILGINYGHVTLFDRWVDSGKTQMWVYEEFSSTAQGHHAIINKSWYSANGFRGLRYNKVTSGGGGYGVWSSGAIRKSSSVACAATPSTTNCPTTLATVQIGWTILPNCQRSGVVVGQNPYWIYGTAVTGSSSYVGWFPSWYIDYPDNVLPGVPICGGSFTTYDNPNVRQSNATCYASPGTTNCPTILGQVQTGETISPACQKPGQMIETNPYWLYVSLSGGRTGWIASWYVNYPDNVLPAVPLCV